MADKSCDLTQLRSIAMQKAQAKRKELQKYNIPVTGEVFSDIMKLAYEEAKDECGTVSGELTEEQMAKLKEICEPCAKRFKIKKAESNL